MLGKKENALIISYFKNKLSMIEMELNKTIYERIANVIEDANSRGLLSSGMTIGGMVKVLSDEVFFQVINSIKMIDEFQSKMNLKLENESLDEIGNLFSEFFTTYYVNQYSTNITEKAKRFIGENLANNITNNVAMGNTVNNIIRTINKEVNEIKIKNKVKKDEPSIRIAKKSLMNSRLALFVSIIATGITVYLNFFYK
ncbi:hypothetical protein [Fictibacillus halophilus]|uniref:hypothetical protein n=1 Tax=Fictibacillus halophilus TaxID=1610490 RepID=UPI001CFC3CCB|nr:hypothetical protein [Fictibacillus halophilus]